MGTNLIRLGSITPKKFYFKGVEVKKMYKGSLLIFDNAGVLTIDFEPKEGIRAYYTTAPTYSDSSSYIEVESGSTIPSDITNMYFKPKTTGKPDLKISGYGLKYVKRMFRPYTYQSSIHKYYYYFGNIDLTDVNWSSVENMDEFLYGINFNKCNSFIGLENLDTSNVTTMYRTFYQFISATDDKQFNYNLSKWNTSKVTNMEGMFYQCSKLTTLDVSGWDVSKVTNMKEMFFYCDGLTTLNLSGWDVSNVTNMDSMFGACSKLKTFILKNMPNDSMFKLLANQTSYIKNYTLHIDESSNALIDSSTRSKFTSNGITIVVE